MITPTRRSLFRLGAAAAGLSSSAAAATFAQKPVSAREQVRQRYFPPVTLVTHEGKQVRFYEDLVKDKVVTINFFYAKCDGVCPGITANLAKVQRLFGNRVGRQIFMYSITLKPEQDTPAVLKEYRDMYDIQPGWTYLTGKPADIEQLRVSLGFTYPDPRIDKDKSQHIGNIRYGNEPLCLWSACPGLAHPKWIVESISWVIRPETAS